MFKVKPISFKSKVMTLPQCQAIARKFATKTEWQKGHFPTYNAARRNGWLAICTKHMREN